MKVKSQVIPSFAIALATTLVLFALSLVLEHYIYMGNVSAQAEHVEVAEKRTSGEQHYISFAFPDGSVKEFAAGRPGGDEFSDAINEGDTGTLTYKEKGKSKRFECFEKDPALGGLTIEPYRQGDLEEAAGVKKGLIFAFFLFWLLFYVGLRQRAFERAVKKAYPQTEIAEQKVKARLLEKGMCQAGSGSKSGALFYAIFELENGVRRTVNFEVSDAFGVHKTMQVNDSGMLTSKGITDESHMFVGFEFDEKKAPPLPVKPTAAPNPADTKPKKKLELDIVVFLLSLFALFAFLGAGVVLQWDDTLAFGGIIIYVVLIFIWSQIRDKKLQAMPEQKTEATVVRKDDSRQITFLLPDGTTKVFSVSAYIFTRIVKGDTGLLTFKERKSVTEFISFE